MRTWVLTVGMVGVVVGIAALFVNRYLEGVLSLVVGIAVAAYGRKLSS